MIKIGVTNPYHDATHRIPYDENKDMTEDEIIESFKSNIRAGHPITFTDEYGTFVSIQADKFASVEIWKAVEEK